MRPVVRKRGWSLASFLILGAIAAVFSFGADMIEYAALRSQMSRELVLLTNVRATQKLLVLDMADSALRFVCVGAMWSWKRWGFYLYLALGVFSMALARRIDPEVELDFDAVLGILSVLIAVLPRFRWFE